MLAGFCTKYLLLEIKRICDKGQNRKGLTHSLGRTKTTSASRFFLVTSVP